jgi:hypothetical protein
VREAEGSHSEVCRQYHLHIESVPG